MPTQEKIETVEDLRRRLDGATAAVLTEYRGLTVQQLQRAPQAAQGGVREYKVVKNRLARLAIEGRRWRRSGRTSRGRPAS